MANTVFILAEGDHDAAFLYKILRFYGIEKYNRAIKEYVKPLDELFKKMLETVSLEDINIENISRPKLLPKYVLKHNDNIICINIAGGDSQKETWKDFINKIKDIVVTDPEQIDAAEGCSFSVLFFLDADNQGIVKRESQINEEILPLFSTKTRIKNDEIVTLENIKTGLFVFTNQSAYNGLLEDILLPLMKKDHENIFDKADEYLYSYEDINEDTGKPRYSKYNHKKALIGITGQLQASGKSNTVIITDTDFLTEEKIKSDDICKKIFSFVQKAMV
jgi:hypothetical protein